MAHPALTRTFLQPAATATMHFQPERIVPTDNKWPKTDDAKKRHRLLKGQNSGWGSVNFACQTISIIQLEVQPGFKHSDSQSDPFTLTKPLH